MKFDTKISENNEVMIEEQFIGRIKGLKLELDLKRCFRDRYKVS